MALQDIYTRGAVPCAVSSWSLNRINERHEHGNRPNDDDDGTKPPAVTFVSEADEVSDQVEDYDEEDPFQVTTPCLSFPNHGTSRKPTDRLERLRGTAAKIRVMSRSRFTIRTRATAAAKTTATARC